jgi:O-acetyl-ADP-ribose deacetylase (regulator of RNase III)
MIHEVAGDILLSGANAIAHGVAPNDDFKQGLALTLREHWPAMCKDFKHFCHKDHPSPGEVWSWKGAGGPWILNLMTQEAPSFHGAHPGHAKTEYVNSALRALRKQIDELKLSSLAITRLATGVGGLDWQEVRPLIFKHLGDTPADIYLYSEYVKGGKADERPSAKR